MQSPALTAKNLIRQEVRQKRRAFSGDKLQIATANLTTELIALTNNLGARTVACYLPVRNEPDTSFYISWAKTRGIRLLFPHCRDDFFLDWIEPTSAEVTPGKYGIPEPVGKVFCSLELSKCDLILAPACAAATTGVRLGWGGGFFDRTLGLIQQAPPVFAVLYSDEIRATLPHEIHDVFIQGAVTPAGTVHFQQAA